MTSLMTAAACSQEAARTAAFFSNFRQSVWILRLFRDIYDLESNMLQGITFSQQYFFAVFSMSNTSENSLVEAIGYKLAVHRNCVSDSPIDDQYGGRRGRESRVLH